MLKFQNRDHRKEKVLLVSDKNWVRAEISKHLSDCQFEVVEADSYHSAVALAETQRPAAILSDIRLNGADSFELSSKVKSLNPQSKVVLFMGYGENSVIIQNLKFCSLDFIEENAASSSLVEFLSTQKPKRSEILREALEQLGLSGRQITILEQISKGESNKRIAEAIHLSEQGVKYHVGLLLKHFAVRNRKELSRRLHELITPAQNPSV